MYPWGCVSGIQCTKEEQAWAQHIRCDSLCVVADGMPKSCILARATCTSEPELERDLVAVNAHASLKDRPVDLLDELQMIRCMQVLSVA